MRKELEKIKGQSNLLKKATFTGRFEKMGTKPGLLGTLNTILLVDICDEKGEYLADHQWFDYSREFASAALKRGDLLRFRSHVTIYQAGYKGNRSRSDVYNPPRTDYKLSCPTNVEVVRPEDVVRDEGAMINDEIVRSGGVVEDCGIVVEVLPPEDDGSEEVAMPDDDGWPEEISSPDDEEFFADDDNEWFEEPYIEEF